jgi:hypothetical protein
LTPSKTRVWAGRREEVDEVVLVDERLELGGMIDRTDLLDFADVNDLPVGKAVREGNDSGIGGVGDRDRLMWFDETDEFLARCFPFLLLVLDRRLAIEIPDGMGGCTELVVLTEDRTLDRLGLA